MPNLPTKILDFRGFDSSRISTLRVGILMPIGNFLRIVSQRILLGIILVAAQQASGKPVRVFWSSRNNSGLVVTQGRFTRDTHAAATTTTNNNNNDNNNDTKIHQHATTNHTTIHNTRLSDAFLFGNNLRTTNNKCCEPPENRCGYGHFRC